MQRFLEVKAAYELLLEGMETGGEGMGGAVFKAGELTADMSQAATAAAELQERVNKLKDKVDNSGAWQG